jgi:Protein of unknown function (DUF2878)
MNSLALHNRPSSAPARLANAVLFNLSWFAIVVSQTSGIALGVVALHLAAHIVLVGRDRGEILLIALVSLFGVALDQVLFLLGVFNVGGQSALAPLWLSCLWPVFATTLRHSFASLHGRPWLAALVGGVGGALSYVAGVHLSDVDFSSPLWGPVVVGVLWALLFPLLMAWAARLNRGVDPLQSWEPGTRRAFD